MAQGARYTLSAWASCRTGPAGVLLALLILAQPARAERQLVPLRSFTGPSAFGLGFGSAVARLGDIDRDGVPDYAVGMPASSSSVPGEVIVYSGRSPRELYRLSQGEAFDSFGSSLAGGADIDGDGVGDLLVGAPNQGGTPDVGGPGGVFLYSGATATLLRRWDGSAGAALGTTVAFVGDLDGDGVPDIAATAGTLGSVSTYSSRTGALLHVVAAPDGSPTFGAAIEDMGDVSGDGVSDLAVGSPPSGCPANPASGSPRSVWLVDGATGGILRSLTTAPGCGSFGESLAAIDDLDGDGGRDLAIASTYDRGPDTLFIYSSGTYASPADTVIRVVSVDALQGNSADGAGWHIASVGDIEGTGGAHIAVGSPRALSRYFNAGAFLLYSVVRDSILDVVGGTARDEELGFAVSSAGDVNGDGRPDVLVGAPGVTLGSQGEESRGGVAIYGYADVAPSRVASVSGQGRIDLASAVPLDVYVEGAPGTYVPSNVVAETIRLRSAANPFQSIPTVTGSTLQASDVDGDGTPEFLAQFPKSNLRDLFRYVRQPEDTMSVVVEGDLRDGRRIQAPLLLTIDTPPVVVARVIPNPVVRSGQLSFRTSRVGPVWLRVFDLQGRLVSPVLSGKPLFAGIHDVPLGPGGAVSGGSGVYFYRLETPDGTSTGRYVVVH